MKSQHFAFLAGSLLLIALSLMLSGAVQTNSDDKAAGLPERTVTVTGEGEVRLRPDLARVTVGIWTHGASATDAEALNLAFVKQIQMALVTAGVDADTLEVTPAALATATYQDFSGATRISGFETRSSIKVTVRNLSRVQPVADAAIAAGATSLDTVVYMLENQEAAKEQAMKAALTNARLRATALVKAEGQKLGELRSMETIVTDSPSANTPPPGNLVFKAQVRATFVY